MICITIPRHVWDIVFSKISFPRLLKLREVSKDFRTVIDEKFENECKWKKLCTPRIESWMQVILKLKYPYRQFCVSDVLHHQDYKKFYISYQKWRRLVAKAKIKFNINLDEFLLKDEEITCTDVFGSFVIFGTNLGRVFCSSSAAQEKVSLLYDFKKHLTEIKFWFTSCGNILVVTLAEKSLQFWHLDKASEVPEPSPRVAEHLCIGVDNRFFAENKLVITECTYRDEQIFYGKSCTIPYKSLNKTKFLSMYNQYDKVIVMIMEDDMIKVYEINFPKSSSENIELTNFIAIYHKIISERESRIISNIFVEETGFIIADNEIIVQAKYPGPVREWTSYILKQEKTSDKLVFATMFANIFFLCWESGIINKIVIKKARNKKGFVIKKFKSSLRLKKPTIAINFSEYQDQLWTIFFTKTSVHYLVK